MSRKFLTALDLSKNELQNAVVQNLASAPATPVKGQLYFNSTGGDNTLYWWDGTTWIPAKDGGGAGFPGYGTITAQTAFGAASNSGAATTVARSDHVHGTPTHDATAHSSIRVNNLAAANADYSMGGYVLTNVGAPATATDAVNRTYVDNAISGLSWKDAVRLASTANVNIAGGAVAIDGVTVSPGNMVLLKNQTAPAENGIYVFTSSFIRSTTHNEEYEILGSAVFVMEGTTQADTAWVCTTDAPITVGTTALTWVQFSGGGSVTAGAGMTQSGNTLNVIAGDASLVVSADSMIVGFAGAGSAVTAARSDHAHDATYLKTFAADCAAATSTTVTHNFNTRDVTVNVYRTTTPWDTVEADVERTTVNAIDVRFATAPTAAQYRIVVQGVDQ